MAPFELSGVKADFGKSELKKIPESNAVNDRIDPVGHWAEFVTGYIFWNEFFHRPVMAVVMFVLYSDISKLLPPG